MTKGQFFQPNPDAPGEYLISPAGTLLLCSGAIHDDDATAKGKARAARMIRAVLDAARAAGYTRGQIAETVLMDFGQPLERKKDVALELAQAIGNDGFIAAMRSAGMDVNID